MWSWEQGHSIYSWTQLLGGSSIKAGKMNEFSRSNIKICLRQEKLPHRDLESSEVTDGHLLEQFTSEYISFCVQTLTVLREIRITLKVTKQLLCREDSTFLLP